MFLVYRVNKKTKTEAGKELSRNDKIFKGKREAKNDVCDLLDMVHAFFKKKGWQRDFFNEAFLT